MALNINDGNRPSRLTLDQRATGEVDGPVPKAHLDALVAAKSAVAPFDYEILRARSHRVVEDAPAPAAAPIRPWWSVWVPLLALAAGLMLVVTIALPDDPVPGTRTRGDAFLNTFVMQDGVGQPWEAGTVLSEGDRVQFAYNANQTGETMVLLSIDGEGTLTVFWPASGDEPVAVVPQGTHLLEDSIELDGARGPEAFVIQFGVTSVEEARSLAVDVFDAEGPEGLQRLARQDRSIDVVIIEKE